MIRAGTFLVILLTLAFLGTTPVAAADTSSSPAPDFNQVYGLIKSNLTGVSDAELNQAAVQSLVDRLSPRVALIKKQASDADSAPAAPLLKTNTFDGNLLYLRVGKVTKDLPSAVSAALSQTAASNKVNGVVLDLRAVGGEDYAAAAAVAKLFLRKPAPLLDWGQGVVSAEPLDTPITAPAAILVNRQTAAAAEALAAVMRETGSALILGSTTAGTASKATFFDLSNGDKLRVSTGPINLGNGTPLPPEGLSPDIIVHVSHEDERLYFIDPYRVIPRPGQTNSASLRGTNQPAGRTRFDEAELMRERRERQAQEGPSRPRQTQPEKPVVQDPVLSRALDVLSALSVVRGLRP